MKQITLSIICCFLMHSAAYSQNQKTIIKGRIIAQKSQKALVGSTVILNNSNFGITDNKGDFEFKDIKDKEVVFKVSNVGFKDSLFVFKPDFKKKENIIPNIQLKKQLVNLKQVIVNGQAVQMTQKGDTLQYNAAAVKLHTNATAKDLVDALPGITRDSDNKLHANGKEVQMVKVDDQLFFKDDVDATLDALPAEIVQNVQVYDDISDLAKFTGFDGGQRSTILNLVTKSKNLRFGSGRYEAASDFDDRYEFDMNSSVFLGANRFNVSGKLNNVNSLGPIFMLSASGRPGELAYGEAKSTYNWKGDHTKVLADYAFNWTDTDQTTRNSQVYFNEDRVITNEMRQKSFSRNHIAHSKTEAFIGKRNKLFFTPKISSSESNSKSYMNELQTLDGEMISNSSTQTMNKSQNNTFGGTLKWQSILTSKLYLESVLFAEKSEQNQDKLTVGSINGENLNETERWEDTNDWIDFQTKFIYMRSKKTGFTLAHKLGYKGEESVKNNSPLDLNYLKNRTTLGFMFKDGRKSTYSFDIGYENTNSVRSMLKKDYQSLVGSLNYYKSLAEGMVSLSYKRDARTPSLYQMYDFIDASTPLQVKLGNPDLKQSYSNTINFYLQNFKKGMIMLSLSKLDNYITQNTFITDGSDYKGQTYAKGTQISEFDNVNGYWNSRITVSFSKFPLGIRPNVSYSFTKLPSLINGEKNISKQNAIHLGLGKGEYRKKDYTYLIMNNLSYSWSKNSLTDRENSHFYNQVYVDFRYKDFKKFFLNLKYEYMYTYQPQQAKKHMHNNMLNLTVGRKLWKDKFELALKMNDLLDQHQWRTTTLTGAYTNTNDTYGLGRYLMLSLKFNFSTLKGGYRVGNYSVPRERTF